MTTIDGVTYSVRGIEPEHYGVADSPELRALLESVDQEAFDCGLEAGEESERESHSQYIAEELEQARDRLKAQALVVANLAADYAIGSGTHLDMPDEHEKALASVRDEIEAIAEEWKA